jgi:hypothetical protein
MGARRFAVGFLVGVMVLLSGIGVMLSLRGLERGEAFTMNIQASPLRLRFEYHGRPPDKKTRQTVIFKKTKGRTNDSSIEVRCESGETRRSGEQLAHKGERIRPSFREAACGSPHFSWRPPSFGGQTRLMPLVPKGG